MKLSPDAVQKLLAVSSDALVIADGDGRIVFANPPAVRLFGYGEDELTGQPIEVLVPEELRAMHRRQRRHYRNAPHARPLVSGLELKGRRKDGEVFPAEIALTPVKEGDEMLVASRIRDISEDRTSDAYFRQLLEAAPDAMIIVDDSGRIAIANDQAVQMFGYARDELLGMPIEALLPESVRERHVQHRRDYLRAPRVRPMGSGMDLYARRADGSVFPVEISLSPVTSSNSVFVSSVIRDVTARKDMEDALIHARQEAERAHKANTAFLAAASHDLRQPVQALSLLTGALRRTVKDPLVKEMVESQQHSLDAMTNLLNSLLDISRLDAGAIRPEIEEFPVQRLFDRQAAEFGRQAKQRKLSFRAEACPAIVRSDYNLLGEIIQNLISNAIRYTEAGRVELSCRPAGDRLAIDVLDTGIGIPAEQLEEIFREFHQLKSSGRNAEGFGLGLAIVRRLADLLDHEVTVRSTPGQGSCFSILVPVLGERIGDAAGAAPGEANAQAGSEGLVLLVEDDDTVAAAWSMLFRAEGYAVATASSADEARAVTESLERAPDLMISDFHLAGDSNGVEAVSAVRALIGRELPALIVSGDTSKVVDDARRLGNSLLLNKPVHTDELLDCVRRAISAGRVPSDTDTPA